MAVSAGAELHLPLLSVKSNLEQEKILREAVDVNNKQSLGAYLEKVKRFHEDNTPVLNRTIQAFSQLKNRGSGH